MKQDNVNISPEYISVAITLGLIVLKVWFEYNLTLRVGAMIHLWDSLEIDWKITISNLFSRPAFWLQGILIFPPVYISICFLYRMFGTNSTADNLTGGSLAQNELD